VLLPPKGVLLDRLHANAAAALGLQADNVRFGWIHGGAYTDKANGQSFTTGSGAGGGLEALSASRPACVRHAVTAVAGTARTLLGNIGSGWTVATQPLYIEARMAMTGTMGADVNRHVGFQNSPFNHGVGIGVFGSISTTNFSVVKCASDVYTGVDTGVAIDTSMHVFRLYRNTAGLWFWQVDSGALTAMTTTGQPTLGNESYGHIDLTNGATAQAQTINTDYAFFAGRRAA